MGYSYYGCNNATWIFNDIEHFFLNLVILPVLKIRFVDYSIEITKWFVSKFSS